MSIICWSCGSLLDDNSKFCNICGNQIIEGLVCRRCGTLLPPHSKFCNQCGYDITTEEDDLNKPKNVRTTTIVESEKAFSDSMDNRVEEIKTEYQVKQIRRGKKDEEAEELDEEKNATAVEDAAETDIEDTKDKAEVADTEEVEDTKEEPEDVEDTEEESEEEDAEESEDEDAEEESEDVEDTEEESEDEDTEEESGDEDTEEESEDVEDTEEESEDVDTEDESGDEDTEEESDDVEDTEEESEDIEDTEEESEDTEDEFPKRPAPAYNIVVNENYADNPLRDFGESNEDKKDKKKDKKEKKEKEKKEKRGLFSVLKELLTEEVDDEDEEEEAVEEQPVPEKKARRRRSEEETLEATAEERRPRRRRGEEETSEAAAEERRPRRRRGEENSENASEERQRRRRERAEASKNAEAKDNAKAVVDSLDAVKKAEKGSKELETHTNEKDAHLAKEYFAKGYEYASGKKGVKDFPKAISFYKKAADLGHDGAQCNLAIYLLEGRGIEKNVKQALRYYKMSADQGNAFAQCNLGLIYAAGKEVKADYEKAVHYLALAGEQGNIKALNALGQLYEKGLGVSKDLEKASSYYKAAADGGHKKAGLRYLALKNKIDDSSNAETAEKKKGDVSDVEVSTKDSIEDDQKEKISKKGSHRTPEEEESVVEEVKENKEDSEEEKEQQEELVSETQEEDLDERAEDSRKSSDSLSDHKDRKEDRKVASKVEAEDDEDDIDALDDDDEEEEISPAESAAVMFKNKTYDANAFGQPMHRYDKNNGGSSKRVFVDPISGIEKIYYMRGNGKLVAENVDGSGQQVLAELPPSLTYRLFVNREGVFVCDTESKEYPPFFIGYDFDGTPLQQIILSQDRLKVPYIALYGTHLYYCVHNVGDTYTIYAIDIDGGNSRVIFETDTRMVIKNLLANEDYVFFESEVYAAPNSETRKDGWFAIELATNLIYNLNSGVRPTEWLLSNPEFFDIDSPDYIEPTDYVRIEYIDCVNNIMWTRPTVADQNKYQISKKGLVPRALGVGADMPVSKVFPVWKKVPRLKQGKIYFDGEKCYFAEGEAAFRTVTLEGKISEQWNESGQGKCNRFFIDGDYIYLDKEGTGVSQYELTFTCQMPVRPMLFR